MVSDRKRHLPFPVPQHVQHVGLGLAYDIDQRSLSDIGIRHLPMPGRWDLLPADLQADVLIRTGTWQVDRPWPRPGGLRIVPWSLCRAWRECILVRDGGQSLLQFLILEHGPEQTLVRAARCTRPALDPCALLRKLLEQHELGSPRADCLQGNAQSRRPARATRRRRSCCWAGGRMRLAQIAAVGQRSLRLRGATFAQFHTGSHRGSTLGIHIAAMQLLLEWPEHAPKADCMSGEALVQAAEHGHVAAMQLLLGWGMDAPTADCQYGMALVAAARGGSEAAVRLLLGQESNPARADCQACRALAVAAGAGNEVMVRLLLEPREHAPRPDGLEGEALAAAAAKGHEGVLQLLLSWMQHSPQSELQNGRALAAAAEARQDAGMLRSLLDWRDRAPPPARPTRTKDWVGRLHPKTDYQDWRALAAASCMMP